MSEELCILNGGVQTVSPQVVYLDFDGAVTSYINAELGVAIDSVTIEDSGFGDGDIAVIVDALNGMFDDVSFTSALPSDGEFSTIYIGVTSAFDKYGAFLGLAETIDSGNIIRDDNAFVFLDSTAPAELVVSVIAHETEHIVHGMDHGGEGLERFAEINVGALQISANLSVSNDTMNVYSNGKAINTTVNAGGVMNVYADGQALVTTVNGGYLYVSGGGRTITTTVIADAMFVNQDGTATNTTVSGGSMHVYNSGVANVTTVIGGYLYVSTGGTATSTTVSGGSMLVKRFGTVNSTTVIGGEMSVFNGCVVTSTTVICGAMYVKDGGCAYITTVNGGAMYVNSGGVAMNTTVSGGYMDVSNGGRAIITTVSGGSMAVKGTATSTTVSGGSMVVRGTATSTTVRGGVMSVMKGGKQTGTLTIEDGATVNVDDGGVIDFDLTPLSPGNAALVNDLSRISGMPTFTVTVKADQALGEYRLADGAGDFNGTLTVKCANEADVTLRVGGERVPIGDKGYSLAVTGGQLLLSVIDMPPDAPELTLSGDAASHELIVTAAWNTDDADCLYAVDGSDELKAYDSPLRFGDDARVRFQTKDAAKNTTDRSLDLMFGRTTGKWAEGYRAWNPGGYDNTVELKGRNVIGGVFSGSDDSTVLVLTDDDNGDALFLDDIYSAYPDGVSSQKRLSKVNEIMAGAGNDVVDLTSPRFDYADGGVTVHGGLGNDVIWANGGVNRLFGDAGDDRIVGADGYDVIVGGIGNDAMHGGGGNDIFCFCGGWGNDTVGQTATGTVTLWFADGDEGKWDAAKCTYADGDNSVTVTGVASTNITLKFGDDGGQYSELQAAGAFDAFTSERIFDDKNVGMHITS